MKELAGLLATMALLQGLKRHETGFCKNRNQGQNRKREIIKYGVPRISQAKAISEQAMGYFRLTIQHQISYT